MPISAGTIRKENTNNIPANPTEEVMTTPKIAKKIKSQNALLVILPPKLTAMICYLK